MRNKVLQILFLLCVFGIVVLPLTNINIHGIKSAENRSLAVFPKLEQLSGSAEQQRAFSQQIEEWL